MSEKFSDPNQSFIISAVIFLTALAFWYLVIKIEEADATLAKDRVNVVGTVTDKIVANAKTQLGLLEYKYQAGGILYHGSDYFKPYALYSVEVGGPVKVAYSQSNPSYSKTVFNRGNNFVMMYLCVGFIFILSGLFLYGGVVRKIYGE